MKLESDFFFEIRSNPFQNKDPVVVKKYPGSRSGKSLILIFITNSLNIYCQIIKKSLTFYKVIN